MGARLQAVSCFSFESQFESMCEGQDMFLGGGGGDPAYDRDGDARQKFSIKTLKETNLGMAKAFFDP